MLSLVDHPKLLRFASLGLRVQAGLRRRGGAVRQMARQRAAFYRQVWQEAAEQLDARIEALGDEVYEIAWDGFCTKVCCNATAIDDPATLALAGDKPAVYRLLARAGLPIPRYVPFSPRRMLRARAFLRQAAGPCVVKPARDTGAGEAITTGITDDRHLAWAVAKAAACCTELIIEQEASGDNYRLLYLDGVLLDAVLRRAPTVVGDGHSTIATLVRRANADRLARGFAAAQVLLTPDAEMRRTLTRQGLTLRSIPPADARIRVKTVINENAARDNEPAAPLLCDSVIESGARAARVIGARLAGVDMITRDPAEPLSVAGGVILEVNTTPGFYYHYHRCATTCPVAIHVLRRLGGVPAGVADS